MHKYIIWFFILPPHSPLSENENVAPLRMISKPWSPAQLCYRLQPSETPVIVQGKKVRIIPLVG